MRDFSQEEKNDLCMVAEEYAPVFIFLDFNTGWQRRVQVTLRAFGRRRNELLVTQWDTEDWLTFQRRMRAGIDGELKAILEEIMQEDT